MKQYFSTHIGRLTIAFVLVLLAFPLIQVGVTSRFVWAAYLGLFMIVASMLFVTATSFIQTKKK